MAIRKRSIILFVSIVTLAGLAFFLKFRTTGFSKEETIHAFLDSEIATRIEISSSNGTYSIMRSDNLWVTKDGETTDSKQLEKFFQLLELIELHSPVSEQQTSGYLDLIENESKSIAIYNNNKRIYTLQLAKIENKDIGVSSGNKLFFLSVKGNSSKSIYDAIPDDAMAFLDKVLINLADNEISAVQVEYPNDRRNNYSIMYNEQSVVFHNHLKQQLPVGNLNLEAINDYKYFFAGIRYNQLDTLNYQADFSKHIFRLKLTTTVDKIWHIDGFVLNDRQTGVLNSSEFAAVLNNKVLVKLSYTDFDPILLNVDYFLKK